MRQGIAVVALLGVLEGPGQGVAAQESGYVVIVNAANATTRLTTGDVARLFLRKTRRWPDGLTALPIDQSSTALLRSAFSKEVLGMSLGEVRDYWLRQTLSGGEVPPVVRPTEDEVILFVRSETGAIAYVSSGTSLPPGVKAIQVTR